MNVTNDEIIRTALRKRLEICHSGDERVRIIEELGVSHGTARIDIAVINGFMHGYEIKSDSDTLQRLQDQMTAFNFVFDKITLVVGKDHLFEAINIVPDWWGIMIAKISGPGLLTFNHIRSAEINRYQDSVAVARLLWRDEALSLLEEVSAAKGFYSKTRDTIYRRLAAVLDQKTLHERVRNTIAFREDWRSDAPLVLGGG